MKKIFLILTALFGLLPAGAQTMVDGVTVRSVRTEHTGKFLIVDMTLGLETLDVDGNRAVLLTPRLVNGMDSIDLPSVGVYGRRRYYYYVRNTEDMLAGKDGMNFKAAQKPDTIAYHQVVPYADWMNGSVLSLWRSEWGCCHTLLAEQYGMLQKFDEVEDFFPTLVYVRPQGNTLKQRSLEGSAFIDFPVDQTVIYPDYRRNTEELGKIQATIDSVREDRDITITQVWLKGFASPESPYAHNRDLAIGRTAALKKYIQQLYRFEDGLIATDYEPEDWAGLRRYVEKSNITHRSEILALIDCDLDPDVKEAKIKRTYPADYRFLLQHCYPALRHTDYRIAYTIRSYSDVEEIRRIMKTQPQKLSLNEFYLVAQECEPGTDDFTEVFETAVRLFPDDETANLNAANAAMRRGDLTAAERYVDKAGNSPEALYARGALAILREDFPTARHWLTLAQEAGMEQAAVTLEQLAAKRH